MLLFLPPYSLELNPIETGFSLFKRWLQKHANLTFAFALEEILSVAMKQCTNETESIKNIYMSCGYSKYEIKFSMHSCGQYLPCFLLAGLQQLY